MNTLTFKVNGSRMKLVSGFKPVGGEKNYSQLKLVFDKEWDEVESVLVTQFFDMENVPEPIHTTIKDGVAVANIHNELRNQSGILHVGVTGAVADGSGVTIATNLVHVPVGEGIRLNGFEDTKLIQQFLEYLAKIESNLLTKDNLVDTHHLKNGIVTEDKLAPDSVTAEKLGDNAVNHNNINTYAIINRHLQFGCVTGDKIAENALTSKHYSQYSILNMHLGLKSVKAQNIADEAINSENMFSADMLAKYLSLPVRKYDASGELSNKVFDTMVEPGVYQTSSQFQKEILIVLRPDSEYHVIQFRIAYNRVEFRGCYADEAGKFDNWEEWTTLNVKVDLNLDSNSENPVSNKAVSEALGKKMTVAKNFTKVASFTDNVDPQLIAYQDEDASVPDMLRIPLSVLMKKIKAVVDEGEFFESDNVENVLQEIGAKLLGFTEFKSIYDNEPAIADPNNTKLLSNVAENSIFMASNSHWTDTPNNETVIFINLRYSLNYDVQIGISIVNSGVIYTRVVHHSKRTVFKDWKAVSDNLSSVWKGKTAAFYGDSLTEENYHYTKGYHKWVQELLGLASYKNYGKSGWGYADVYNKVCNLTDSADIVFVGAGVNEQTYSVPLGTIADRTTDTTYGRLNLLCGMLKEKYPTSTIVFITPHYQTKYPHNDGITSYEVSKAVKEVCDRFAISVFDNFTLSGICESNLSVFTTDNCHWNDTAHEMVGKNLASFVSGGFRYAHGYSTPTIDWSGKTVTCELGDADDNSAHLVALVAVDDDMNIGATITRELTAVECVNMVSAAITGGNCYGNSSGEVSNASYTKNCGKSSVHTQTVSEDNTATWDVGIQTFNRDVTESYILVPIIVSGKSFPFSFKISDIAVKVNGNEKPILALGSFFKSDKEIIKIV